MAVRIEREGVVATVVIDRPKRCNAVDARTARELADAFRAVEATIESGESFEGAQRFARRRRSSRRPRLVRGH